jgi:hypothetical protein
LAEVAIADELDMLRPQFVCLFLACFLQGPSPQLVAQSTDMPPKPIVEGVTSSPSKVDPLDSELERIMTRWAAATASIRSVHGGITKSEFNKTFATETCFEGEFFLESSSMWRIDFSPIVVQKGERSKRRTSDGTPFSRAQGQRERWISNSESLISIDDNGKSYVDEPCSEDLRKRFFRAMLPFLMESTDAGCHVRLISVDPEKQTATLNFTRTEDKTTQDPRGGLFTSAWTEGRVLLSTIDWIPVAVRLMDQNGLETVLHYRDISINDSQLTKKMNVRWNGNPYIPNLEGYQKYKCETLRQPLLRIQK